VVLFDALRRGGYMVLSGASGRGGVVLSNPHKWGVIGHLNEGGVLPGTRVAVKQSSPMERWATAPTCF